MRVKSEFRILPLQDHLYYMRLNGYVKKKIKSIYLRAMFELGLFPEVSEPLRLTEKY